MNRLKFFLQNKKLWQWFSQHQEEFGDDPNSPVYGEFYQKLSSIHPALVFEISPKDEHSIRTLVISCDGVREAVPVVEDLVSKAPVIKDWKVVAFRQPIKESITIDMEGLKLSTDDIKFEYQVAPADTVDLVLYVKGLNEENKNDYLRAVFILLDASIGEFLVMTKIRHMDFLPMPASGSSFNKLSELLDLLSTDFKSDK